MEEAILAQPQIEPNGVAQSGNSLLVTTTSTDLHQSKQQTIIACSVMLRCYLFLLLLLYILDMPYGIYYKSKGIKTKMHLQGVLSCVLLASWVPRQVQWKGPQQARKVFPGPFGNAIHQVSRCPCEAHVGGQEVWKVERKEAIRCSMVAHAIVMVVV
jgi:hypothetical protein